MAYIKSLDHFLAVCRKIATGRNIKVGAEEIELLVDFYMWNKNYSYEFRAANLFTWKLKQEEVEITAEAIELIKSEVRNSLPEGFEDNPDEDFVKKVLIGRNLKSGVYFIYNRRKELMYVGKSKNISGRIISSIRERSKANPFYVRFVDCPSIVDASILEPYFINKHCPPFNNEFASLELPSVVIKNIPKMSEFIKIYKENAK